MCLLNVFPGYDVCMYMYIIYIYIYNMFIEYWNELFQKLFRHGRSPARGSFLLECRPPPPPVWLYLDVVVRGAAEAAIFLKKRRVKLAVILIIN